MYFSSDHTIAARNEAIASAHQATSIVIDSVEKLLGLHASTGKAALALVEAHAMRGKDEGGETLWQGLAEKHGTELLTGYLKISAQTREKFWNLVEAQIVSTSKWAMAALEKPPECPTLQTQEAAEVVTKEEAGESVDTEASSVGKKLAQSKKGR